MNKERFGQKRGGEVLEQQAGPAEKAERGPFFVRGFNSGHVGITFPLTEFRRLHWSEITPDQAAEFHEGYIRGLSERLALLKIRLADIGVTTSLEHIFIEDAGVLGLNAGLKKQPPSAPRTPRAKVKSGENTTGAHFIDGYKIGWVIRIVKEEGIIPPVDAIPTTQDLFVLYRKAVKGDFSGINYKDEYKDSETRQRQREERKAFSPEEKVRLAAEERAKEIERAVLAFGIGRWLSAKGITVTPDYILYLNPQVRRGFAHVVNRESNGKNGRDENYQKGMDLAGRILVTESMQKKTNTQK